MFTVNFKTQKDAEVVLWLAAAANLVIVGTPEKKLMVRFGDSSLRDVCPVVGGGVYEVGDSGGGEITWDQKPVFSVK